MVLDRGWWRGRDFFCSINPFCLRGNGQRRSGVIFGGSFSCWALAIWLMGESDETETMRRPKNDQINLVVLFALRVAFTGWGRKISQWQGSKLSPFARCAGRGRAFAGVVNGFIIGGRRRTFPDERRVAAARKSGTTKSIQLAI